MDAGRVARVEARLAPSQVADMDVQAYLHRIRYERTVVPGADHPSIDLLRALHRAHLLTVPFENLEISLGREIVCDEARILYKIVNERRGGFCYELNGAFAALLRALGFRVTLLSGRVTREDGSDGPEFDHLTLRVDLDENMERRASPPGRTGETPVTPQPWLADVGFGECFLEPLRLESGMEQEQDGRIYRLASRPAATGVFDLQVMAEGKWKREYAFTLQPRELSDFAPMCRYHQTSPDSHFTRQPICSMATPDGRITLSDEKLIETRAGSRQERLLSSDQERLVTLRDLFGVVLPD